MLGAGSDARSRAAGFPRLKERWRRAGAAAGAGGQSPLGAGKSMCAGGDAE